MTNGQRTFYIETFGCQMNVHDSEKVRGDARCARLPQVATPEEADLVVYNTCSVRDKAEQKVYSRLQAVQATGRATGKMFGVLGCVAQQEGERIFERAPHVGLVCGSASYHRLPELLTAARSRPAARHRAFASIPRRPSRRPTRAATIRTAPTSPSSKAATRAAPIAWCRSRGGRERSRTARSILDEVARLAGGGCTEIQLLGQNVNSYRDPSPAPGCGTAWLRRGTSRRCWPPSPGSPASGACASPLRIRAISARHRGRHRRQSGPVQPRAPAGASRVRPRAGTHAAAVHPRVVPGTHRLASAARAATSPSPPT